MDSEVVESKHLTRRQKKRAAVGSSPSNDPAAPFELAQPDRSGPKGKSLLDIAAERQAQLAGVDVSSLAPEHVDFPPSGNHQTPHTKQQGTAYAFSGADVPPWATATLYAITLTILHLTLDVAVYHQYAQEIEWAAIFARLPVVCACFFAIVLVLHLDAAKRRFPRARQAVFLAFATLAGTYLVRVGNTKAYMAVMRQAPPLGTLLIWSFVEMDLGFAVAALGVNAAYVWWSGFLVM